MESRWLNAALTLGVTALGILPLLLTPVHVEAQGVSSQLVAQYLERTGLSWHRDAKDVNSFHLTKTTGLKKADRVEIVITNFQKDQFLTLRAFPQSSGKYLSLAGSTDQAGLTKNMLQRNSTAFGTFFIDEGGDIGFRYVFTTESGLGYTAFKTVVDALLRIADKPLMTIYNSYR